MADSIEPKCKRRWNWWKIGFFVMLVLFEGAREWAVLATAKQVSPAAIASVSHYGDFVEAQGTWKRIGWGDKLQTNATRIQCDRTKAQCIEASASAVDDFVMTPSIDVFDAKFSDDAVTYENDIPACVIYRVRIDLTLDKVFASRIRMPDASGPCLKLDEKVDMELGNAIDPNERNTTFDNHFVPLVRLAEFLFNVF